MADEKKLSIQEILAACRKQAGVDPGTASQPPATEPKTEPKGSDVASSSTEGTASPSPPPQGPVQPAGPAKSGKPMSVAEMLAAARAEKGGAAPPSADSPPPQVPSAARPAAKPAGAGDPKKMSVAEMLAAARGEKGAEKGGAPSPPTAKAPPKAVPGKGAAEGKAVIPKAAANVEKSTGPMDTSSILAAARGNKPGPMSKAEAAAKAAPAVPAKGPAKAPPMPAKPEYAKGKAPVTATEDRRGFFSIVLGSFLAAGFASLSMAGGLGGLMVARFFFPNLLIEPPSRFKVGFPSEFSPGTVDTKFIAQFGVWVVNTEYEGQPEIFALKSVCTHLGCTPNWLEAEQKFKCPCHGSGFYKDGVNFEGPAPRPLERYAIRLADDGQIEIDKAKTYQEQLGQWNDPASFVPV